MTEVKRRSGMRYVMPASEGTRLLSLGDGRILVVAPNDPPKVIRREGGKEIVEELSLGGR